MPRPVIGRTALAEGSSGARGWQHHVTQLPEVPGSTTLVGPSKARRVPRRADAADRRIGMSSGYGVTARSRGAGL